VDVIIDNTPGVIILSAYDPIRREIARVSLERLIEDGRIHPARIETVVERVRGEIEGMVQGIGETAAFEAGLTDVHPKILRLLGLLRFRTLRGYNLLLQSTETALIAGFMASEAGLRDLVARRAGLLHAIAWAEDEGGGTGPGVTVSSEIASKFGESSEVVHAIAALAPGVEARTPEAVLVQVARRVSEARPGARKDNLQSFIERMHRLEEMAQAMKGVRHAYAVKGGKELRVLVESSELSDEETLLLSRDLAKAIEREISYTGEIKVNVIRETRAVDFAV
jgi:ribonuclease Y